MRGVFVAGFIIVFSLFPMLHPVTVIAQLDNLNIAVTHSVSPEAKPGDIVSLTGKDGIMEPAKIASDEKMFGVVVETSAFIIRTQPTNPVARSGVVLVNVTTLGGNIAIGDYITSSQVKGFGQKAENLGGYMLGVAMQKFTEKDGVSAEVDKQKIRKGQIKVEIGIGPASPVLNKASGGLFGTIKQLSKAVLYNISTSNKAEKIIRYVVASLVAVVIIFINFKTFGRNITQGIEAIGRNPLAKLSIQSMIIVNVVLIAIISIGGIILSLAIISL